MNVLNEPQKLHTLIHPKDKIWHNNESLLLEIENYAKRLQVVLKEPIRKSADTNFNSEILLESDV